MTPVEKYILDLPSERRPLLENLRTLVHEIIPDVEETFSYGVPTYKLDGRSIVAFSANKDDYSLYPFGHAAIEALQDKLVDFKQTKGSVHFSDEQPIPDDIMRKIIEFRRKAVS